MSQFNINLALISDEFDEFDESEYNIDIELARVLDEFYESDEIDEFDEFDESDESEYNIDIELALALLENEIFLNNFAGVEEDKTCEQGPFDSGPGH